MNSKKALCLKITQKSHFSTIFKDFFFWKKWSLWSNSVTRLVENKVGKNWSKLKISSKFNQNVRSNIIFDCENNEIFLGSFKTLWKEKYVLWVCGVQQAKLKEAVLCIRVWKGSHEMHEWAANQSCSIELYSRYMYRLQDEEVFLCTTKLKLDLILLSLPTRIDILERFLAWFWWTWKLHSKRVRKLHAKHPRGWAFKKGLS